MRGESAAGGGAGYGCPWLYELNRASRSCGGESWWPWAWLDCCWRSCARREFKPSPWSALPGGLKLDMVSTTHAESGQGDSTANGRSEPWLLGFWCWVETGSRPAYTPDIGRRAV